MRERRGGPEIHDAKADPSWTGGRLVRVGQMWATACRQRTMSEQRTQFQQAVPVGTVAGKAGYLVTQDDTDFSQTHIRSQLLKALSAQASIPSTARTSFQSSVRKLAFAIPRLCRSPPDLAAVFAPPVNDPGTRPAETLSTESFRARSVSGCWSRD